MQIEVDASKKSRIHLLDVGVKEYGDAVLCQFGSRSVLIDGSHPGDDRDSAAYSSIPEQISDLIGADEPLPIDLLIVSHAHQDHIGCLPNLVKDRRLKVKWALVADPGLGWGRAPGEDRDAQADKRAVLLAAALREEARTKKGTDDAALRDFLTDAVTLETRYIEMLENLEEQGTEIVRFGRDNIEKLLAEFADIKLKVIGPSQNHLLICADIINRKTMDSLQRATDAFTKDNSADEVSIYRSLIAADIDSSTAGGIDAKSRPGPAINLQSIITQFEYGGHKFLFAGDFQFAKPEVDNNELEESVIKLRQIIKNEAPYSFVKLSHHGSYNSFSEEIYEDLGATQHFGLCAGEESTHHPSRRVLELLDKNRDKIKWARTDHNGLVTLTFNSGVKQPQISLSKGSINDAKPNDLDVVGAAAQAKPPQETALPSAKPAPVTQPQVQMEEPRTESTGLTQVSGSEFIELSAKILNTPARFSFKGDFTFEIEPLGSTASNKSPDRVLEEKKRDSDFLIGGGRNLSDLLFVTSRAALADNIGRAETKEILDLFDAQKIPLYADLPKTLHTSTQAIEFVRRELQRRPKTKGVVILGGYDVVPAQVLDCLPPDLRSALPYNDDPDNFIVWSDSVYGDFDGDGLPEVPVSRIPDGKSPALVSKALQANYARAGQRRFGIRNDARPFAVDVFEAISGTGDLLVSRKTVFDQAPPYAIGADNIYFMLHGDYTDGSRFWGEGNPLNREAVNVGNLPDEFNGVVFTGCCWGALTVNTPAGLVNPNRPFGQKTTDSSIALSFLARGANAFIGCTGAHYSPLEKPFNYFGEPMHTAFWRNYKAGFAPAEALFRAKIEYLEKMPHGRTGTLQQAIEYKILRQFTCLGLGW